MSEKCFECDKPAEWVRYTQFAGNHYFCEEHARQEEDFKGTSPSYYDWEKINE
jgi:hypothetical protein